MKKTPSFLTPWGLFIRFAATAGLGLLIWFAPSFVKRFFQLLCIGALLLNGLPAVAISLFQRHEPHPHALQSGITSLALAGLICLFPGVINGGISLVIGLWSLMVGFVQLGYILQLFLTHEKGKLRFLFLSIASFATGLVLLFSPLNASALRFFSGGYLILYGFWQLIDLVGLLVNRNVESSAFLSRIRIKPPVLLTALLPSVWLNALEKQRDALTHDLITAKPTPLRFTPRERLQVVFHLGRHVALGFGHVDISLRGYTFSYGCYDESSNRVLGLLSDGVIMLCPTEPYLAYCRQEESKLLVSYSLGLSTEEAERVSSAIQGMLQRDCEPWQPGERPEYALGASFFKVRRGGFQVYNALRTNCAAMAEMVATQGGLNLLPPNGFVTPGAYFDFLQKELRDPESNVLQQTIYAAPK